MPARPWITPEQVREYSETPEVVARTDTKLTVDISRAEQYILTYTHNKELLDMDELPEEWTYPLIQPKLIEKYLQMKNTIVFRLRA